MDRSEVVTRGDGPSWEELATGVRRRFLASGTLGARGLATALTVIQPGAGLPYHTRPVSEAVVVLDGRAEFLAEGRRHRLEPLDAIHLPAGTAHAVVNPEVTPASLHSSFGSDTPTWEAVAATFSPSEGGGEGDSRPERLVRFNAAAVYELAPGALFRDLIAGRLGFRGICGGYGRFEPGASLPCHYHGFDESITIIEGTAVCQVAGREYTVSGRDTVCIPRSRPHRFLNRAERSMAMIWVYAGDEPDRTIVDPRVCEGSLPLTNPPGS
jgi:quercetin dioxygenase-like cupin family protein